MGKHWHTQLQLHLLSTRITVLLRKAMMLLLLKQGIQFIKNIKNNSFCLACTQTAKLAGVSYETDVSPFSPPSHIFDSTRYCAGFVDNSCLNPRFKLFFSSSFLVSCITHSTFTLSQSWAILPWTRSFSNPFSPFSHPGAKLPTSQNGPEHSKLSSDFFFFF